MDDEIDAALAALAAHPDDPDRRADAARLCAAGGRAVEAALLLGEGLIHLNAHDPGVLPCLCRRCLRPELAAATTGEDSFVREFAVAAGRVLYFWLPAELAADRDRVSRDVATRMRQRFGG